MDKEKLWKAVTICCFIALPLVLSFFSIRFFGGSTNPISLVREFRKLHDIEQQYKINPKPSEQQYKVNLERFKVTREQFEQQKFQDTKKAAEAGDAEAQYKLGVCYQRGEGVKKDYVEAIKWYTMAAEQGHVGAQDILGFRYYNGLGVERDVEKAIKWYLKAAEQGFARAQIWLAYCYENGIAIEQGDVFEQYQSGEYYYNLGNRYYNGDGVEKDYKEAVKWYTKAAEQGYADAQNRLGLCYANGLGVEENYTEAVKWFRKAAEQGDIKAQKALQDL